MAVEQFCGTVLDGFAMAKVAGCVNKKFVTTSQQVVRSRHRVDDDARLEGQSQVAVLLSGLFEDLREGYQSCLIPLRPKVF